MKQVNQIWRLFSTALSFILFGIGGFILSVIVSPLMFLIFRNPDCRQRSTRRMGGYLFVLFLWFMKVMGVLSYRITGLENIRHGDNKLIIANHPTLIDVIFLVSLFPMVDCVVKEDVFRNPAMRGLVKPARYISAGHHGRMINTCVGRLKSGSSLLLFPEGTRSVYGQPLQFKLGASSIAIKSQAEFLPVIIQCDQPGFLAKDVPWYRIPPQKPFLSVQIQDLVTIDKLIPDNMSSRTSTRALNKSLMSYFEEKLT